jgi:hypothetical protein
MRRPLIAFAFLSIAAACGQPPRKIAVDHTGGLRTTEAGGTATFSVWLTAPPTDRVVIGLHSTNDAEGRPSKPELVFLPESWDRPQTVEILGIDDQAKDGDQRYAIVLEEARSKDLDFLGVTGPEIDVVNTDDESPAVLVTTPSRRIVEGGTLELSLKLTAQPSAPVRLTARVESDGDRVLLETREVVFYPTSWDKPRTVVLRAPDSDHIDRGTERVTLGFSAAESLDPAFSGLSVGNLSIDRVENDSAVISAPSTLAALEGTSVELEVKLTSEPTADVTVTPSLLFVNVPTPPGVVFTPSRLVFTPTNWSQPQRFAVRVEEDLVDNPFLVADLRLSGASMDASYASAVATTTLTIDDNDAPGIVLRSIFGDYASTRESGDDAVRCATVNIATTTTPSGPVFVELSSTRSTEGVPKVTRLPVQVAPTPVSVCGVDDTIADGSQDYQIVAKVISSTDPAYPVGLTGSPFYVTNLDDGELPGDTCGQAIALTVGAPAGSYTTRTSANDYADCGQSGPDMVFAIPVGANEKVRIEAAMTTTSWKLTLRLRETCELEPATCNLVSADSHGHAVATYQNGATPKTVYAIVDGATTFYDGFGSFTIAASVAD